MGKRQSAVTIILAACLALNGCAAIIGRVASGVSDKLSMAFLNQDDPEMVRTGMPSYMLLVDSMVQDEKPSPTMLAAAANMYASYGAVFADDDVRSSRLTRRARNYASEAMCLSYAGACHWADMSYDQFVASIAGVGPRQAELLYVYGFAMLAYIQAHTSDWNALADLPQAEALLLRYLELAGPGAKASAHTYLGILMTLRPPAMGGQPEEARKHFETAIAMTGGLDLSVKVEFAKGYAKTLYDRELHDRLVNEVLTASPYAEGYTLMNVIAQEEASALRADADNYF